MIISALKRYNHMVYLTATLPRYQQIAARQFTCCEILVASKSQEVNSPIDVNVHVNVYVNLHVITPLWGSSGVSG